VNLRIRCAWQNTPQGLLNQPVTEFVKLAIDGAEANPELVAKARPNGLHDDHYHLLRLPDLPAGKHIATAVARMIDTKTEVRRTLEFFVE
jgi:hypothetical protein